MYIRACGVYYSNMRGYDEWLEAPYVNAAREQDNYERWCEANDLDPEDDNWGAYEDFLEDQQPDPDLKED